MSFSKPNFKQNLVVAHYKDGKTVKGTTFNFSPRETFFHITPSEDKAERKSVEIKISQLKAVFFVKSLEGNKNHPRNDKSLISNIAGNSKIKVEFSDGEELIGTTVGYSLKRQGFFLFPLNPKSNNERIYVVSSAVKKIEKIEKNLQTSRP